MIWSCDGKYDGFFGNAWQPWTNSVDWVLISDILSSSFLFFALADVKSILHSSSYHLQGSEIQVWASLIRTPAFTANNTAPTCEHTSSRPAKQLRCAVIIIIIVPPTLAAIHGFKGVSLSRWEWLTYDTNSILIRYYGRQCKFAISIHWWNVKERLTFPIRIRMFCIAFPTKIHLTHPAIKYLYEVRLL